MFSCRYRGASQSPYRSYREGASYIHMHILGLFPTDMDVLHKVPVEKAFCKVPGGFMKPL